MVESRRFWWLGESMVEFVPMFWCSLFCLGLCELKQLKLDLKCWNLEVFGNVEERIKVPFGRDLVP